MSILVRVLSGRIAPMVYVMMFMSVIIGFFFATGFLVGVSESVLWNSGVLVSRQLWGMVLFSTASIAMYGFFTDSKSLISMGGVSGFAAWLFACIALIMTAHWYVFVTVGLLHLAFHAYVVLASATDTLHRRF